jgi:hypothetical protein
MDLSSLASLSFSDVPLHSMGACVSLNHLTGEENASASTD